MNDRERMARGAIRVGSDLVAHPRFAEALTIAATVFAATTEVIRAMIGWPGAIAILAVLVVLGATRMVVRRERPEWTGALPISMLALFGWMGLSLLWSEYNWASLGGLAYAAGFAIVGLTISLTRDLIQIVRGVGEGLRIVLAASLCLEVLLGIVLDSPFPPFGIEGNLASGGPIQGVAGSRNALGFLALIALITFAIEIATRSIDRGRAALSLVLVAAALGFTGSPISMVAIATVVSATAALLVLRRTSPAVRRWLRLGLIGVLFIAATLAWALRNGLVAWLSARSELAVRERVWSTARQRLGDRDVQGLGWVGQWPQEVEPFPTIIARSGGGVSDALSAYVDAILQIGYVGLVLLVVALGIATLRAWMLATERRSLAHLWPALVLVALIVVSAAESFLLREFGLMLFVAIASLVAGQRSWRERLR